MYCHRDCRRNFKEWKAKVQFTWYSVSLNQLCLSNLRQLRYAFFLERLIIFSFVFSKEIIAIQRQYKKLLKFITV